MRRRAIAVLLAFLTASAMLVLEAGTAAADTTYTPSPWNGRKVYLSPSSQSANVGCDGYNEKDGARAIAAKVKDYLFARSYAVRIGSGTSAENVTSSNAWGSSVDVPIHSNATTFNCTAPFDPAKGGTWLLYKPSSSAGLSLSQGPGWCAERCDQGLHHRLE